MKLEPDMVVLQFCLNDVVERYQALASYGGTTNFLGVDTRASIRGISGFFIRNFKSVELFVRWLKNLARDRQEYAVWKLSTDNLSEELIEAWSEVSKEIDGIVSITKENDIPFVLVILPYSFQLRNPAELRQPQDKLIEIANKNEVPYLDFLPEFFNERAKNEEIFLDHNHLALKGSELVAEALTKQVLKDLNLQ